MTGTTQAVILILVMAAVTALLRFLPFALFAKKAPGPILYLGEVLPYAVMAMLVVYCLKGTDFAGNAHGIPEVISVALVVFLHKWKHNTLLSILVGTICYMLFVQVIFA